MLSEKTKACLDCAAVLRVCRSCCADHAGKGMNQDKKEASVENAGPSEGEGSRCC
jgi:hypothetical protein